MLFFGLGGETETAQKKKRETHKLSEPRQLTVTAFEQRPQRLTSTACTAYVCWHTACLSIRNTDIRIAKDGTAQYSARHPTCLTHRSLERGGVSEHYSEFRQIDMAFLPWGWISVAIHPVGPKRKLRSPLFCANTKFASSREILSTTALLENI